VHLRLSNIIKSFDGQTNAVDDISIDVHRGEFVTFLGPSGSGKTTTLMMIAGFENPTGGRIELDGQDLTLTQPYGRNIGMVFQNYALFPHMTVLKNVIFPLKMRNFPKTEITERAKKMLDLVGLRRYSERYPRELSGGQQQRVALARGLVFNPDVLLLDEPLGALDKNLREQMQVEITRIHQELGTTMIYVTHDQTEAMTMSDRIAVFSNGHIEQIGSPLEIYNRPVSRFVGEFVGDSNILAGRMDSARPGWIEMNGIGPARLAKTGAKPHGEVDLLIRPERLRLAPRQSANERDNEIDMTVSAIINYGDSVVAIGKAQGLALRVRVAGGEAELLNVGAKIKLFWAPADAHVITRR
jgi:putative spermidine/putrescine transport system ATP-binding protein